MKQKEKPFNYNKACSLNLYLKEIMIADSRGIYISLIFKTKQNHKKDGGVEYIYVRFMSQISQVKSWRERFTAVKDIGVLKQQLKPSAWVPQLQRGNLAAIRMLLDWSSWSFPLSLFYQNGLEWQMGLGI